MNHRLAVRSDDIPVLPRIKEENDTHENVSSVMDVENETSSPTINHTNNLVMRNEDNHQKKRRENGNF